MMRYLGAALLAAICIASLGCTDVEPRVQSTGDACVAPAPAGVPEPDDAGEQEPPRSAAETDPNAGAGLEGTQVPGREETRLGAPPNAIRRVREPNSVRTEADAGPAEVNEPPVPIGTAPDSNDHQPSTVSDPGRSFHDRYAEILTTYVREDGLVNYGDLRRRRLELKSVLTMLDELDPNVYQAWPQQEKLAFWINAYNLKMLEIIARNYPIESSWWLRLTWSPSDIRHIKDIWTDYRFLVMDEEFTLAEVERRYFRKTFDDPRVWLALTYASQSSPPLRVQPYGAGANDDSPLLDRQLDEQVRRFLAGPQGLQIDRRNRVVRLSALFKPNWRGREFVGRYGTDKKFKAHEPATRAVLNFLTNYLPREEVEFLEVENYSLEYLNFDWRLNDTARGY